MRLFDSKKAVSPLIATVLLVGFALVLGIVVMAAGGDYLSLEETSEEGSSPVIDILNIINTCRDSGAITPEEYTVLKDKLE